MGQKRRRRQLSAVLLSAALLFSAMGTAGFAVRAEEVTDGGHIHNEEGWVCTFTETGRELTCEQEEHTHTEVCVTEQTGQPQEAEPDCGMTEHTHSDACYQAVGEWECMAPVTGTEEPEGETDSSVKPPAAGMGDQPGAGDRPGAGDPPKKPEGGAGAPAAPAGMPAAPAADPADGELKDFPSGGMPNAAAYRLNADGGPGEEIASGTVMKLGDGFLLGFTWLSGQTLADSGIATDTNYKLCEIPSQIQIDGSGEIPIYAGAVQFATVHVGEVSGNLRSVWITFERVDLANVSAYFGCALADGGEAAPADGVIEIVFPGNKTLSIPVEDFLPKGPQLGKESAPLNDLGVASWTVTYTAPEAGYENSPYIEDKIKSPVSLWDTLPDGLEYVAGSAKENGVPVTDRVQYDAGTRRLTYTLPGAAAPGSATVLTYETRLTDAAVYRLWNGSPMTFANDVRGMDENGNAIAGLEAEAGVSADQNWVGGHAALDKTGTYSFAGGKRTASWAVTVNTVGREYEYLRVVDTLGKGLELDRNSVKVNGSAVTVGSGDGAACTATKNPDGTTVLTLYLYRENGQLQQPDASGRYRITYGTEVSRDYFQQTPDPGNPGQLLVGDNDVKNDATLQWKWRNAPGTGAGEPPLEPSIGKGPVMPAGLSSAMLQKKGKSYDQSNHLLEWEVVINPNTVNIVSAKFEDVLTVNGIFIQQGVEYRLTLAESQAEIEQKIRQALPPGASIRNFSLQTPLSEGNRPIGFKFEIDNLGEAQMNFSVVFEVEAAFWTANRAPLPVSNMANLDEVVVDIDGQRENIGGFSARGDVSMSNTVLEKSSVRYDPVTKEMTWQIVVNKSKVKGLGEVTIKDRLPDGMTYVDGSAQVDGQIEPVEYAADTGVLTCVIEDDLVNGETVTLTYKARVDVNFADGSGGRPFLAGDRIAFLNSASMQAAVEGARESYVECEAVVKNPLVSKTVQAEKGNKLTYTATLNPHGVKLLPDDGNVSQLYLKDAMPAGLVPDLDSIRLYEAKVTAEGEGGVYQPVLAKGAEVTPAPEDIVYQVQREPDGSAANVFQIPVEDETAYILTYDAYVVQTNVELVNKLSLEGSVLPENSSLGTGNSTYELKAFGDADIQLPQGNWSIQLAKVDQDGKAITFTADEVNAGKTHALFGLYTDKAESAKLLEAACDPLTGICTFSQPKQVLSGVTKLYVKEIAAPTGYAANDEYLPVTAEQLAALSAGGKLELEIENVRADGGVLPGKIVVELNCEGEAPDTPVEFTLYKDESCTEKLGTAAGTAAGNTLSFEGLYPGRAYYLRQTSGPAGYRLDDTVYSVRAGDGTGTSKLEILLDMKTAVYKVEHYKQQDDGSYLSADAQELYGEIGKTVAAAAKDYEGYIVNSSKSLMSGVVVKPWKENGVLKHLVLAVYYDKEPAPPEPDQPTPPEPDKPTPPEPDKPTPPGPDQPTTPSTPQNPGGPEGSVSTDGSAGAGSAAVWETTVSRDFVPETGDETDLVSWVILMGAAVLGMILVLPELKRQTKR